VHRNGRLAACLHAQSHGLITLDRVPAEKEQIKFTVMPPLCADTIAELADEFPGDF
jgi:hypothetical protein